MSQPFGWGWAEDNELLDNSGPVPCTEGDEEAENNNLRSISATWASLLAEAALHEADVQSDQDGSCGGVDIDYCMADDEPGLDEDEDEDDEDEDDYSSDGDQASPIDEKCWNTGSETGAWRKPDELLNVQDHIRAAVGRRRGRFGFWDAIPPPTPSMPASVDKKHLSPIEEQHDNVFDLLDHLPSRPPSALAPDRRTAATFVQALLLSALEDAL